MGSSPIIHNKDSLYGGIGIHRRLKIFPAKGVGSIPAISNNLISIR